MTKERQREKSRKNYAKRKARAFAILSAGKPPKCAKCGAKSVHQVDHIEPVLQGAGKRRIDSVTTILRLAARGIDPRTELQFLCGTCHAEKTAQEVKAGIYRQRRLNLSEPTPQGDLGL